jgi:5-(carboxyamino)imidazole ribonucleotide mutase
VPWEAQAISAHRAPDALLEYLSSAVERGLEIIIAAAGGAAHLPGVCAAKTVLPVLGVPMESPSLKGLDSLLSIVQMPGGVPVGTLAIGKPGAINAALLAVSILGVKHPNYRLAYDLFRKNQTAKVLADRFLKLPE